MSALGVEYMGPHHVWSAIEEIDATTDDEWSMALLIRRAMETVG